jgi:glycosyltransferase involved in cell wall biosynthesis
VTAPAVPEHGPSIALVIPVHNGAAYLRDALRSALAQEGARFTDIVVVDDGSTDASTTIAEAFPPPVRVVRQAHEGAASARNNGLSATTAELVAFLDADDLLPPRSLAARLNPIAEYLAARAVMGRLVQFVSPELDAVNAARFAVSEEPVAGPMLCAMLFRKQVFEQVGAFDATLTQGDFIDWFLRARAGGIVPVQIDEVVLRRRVHGDNMTVRRKTRRSDYLTVVRRHLARTARI